MASTSWLTPFDERFYHYGDTAILSDMRLHAELYRPNIGCVGIANSIEVIKAKGARPVVTDVLDARLKFAHELGHKGVFMT